MKEAEKTFIQETENNKCQILSQVSQTVTFGFVTVVCECLCRLEGVFDDCHNCHIGSTMIDRKLPPRKIFKIRTQLKDRYPGRDV